LKKGKGRIKVDFIAIFTSLLLIAGVVEALMEVLKGPYVQIKNIFLVIAKKALAKEMSAYEKRFLTLLLGVLICLAAGFGVDIPAWSEPLWFQCILAGILVSLGSNMLHLLLSIAVAIKDAVEKVKQANNTSGSPPEPLP
jgi:hypothetical protein